MNKKHFVFDLDDTLTNTNTLNQKLFIDTVKPYIKKFNKDVENSIKKVHTESNGKPMYILFDEVIQTVGFKADPYVLAQKNEELHVKKIDYIEPFDYVEELLIALKSSGKTVSLCSNRPSMSLDKILKSNGMITFFDEIVSCADEGHEKPDPYCLLSLVSKYKGKKQDFIYIGNSRTDRDFAESAGVDFLIIDQYLNQNKFFKSLIQAFSGKQGFTTLYQQH